MKKIILISFCFLTFFSCRKDEPSENEEVNVIEEIPQIDVPDANAVYINVEIPENNSKEEYKLIDNKDRELPINSTENIKAEENTIVSLVHKQTGNTIFIAYILNDNTSSAKSRSVKSKNLLSNNICEKPNTVGIRSTARFILANILNPISAFHVGSPSVDSFYEILKSNILCNVFTENQILNIENAVNQLAKEGKNFQEIAVSSLIKNIVEPLTGGLFADCWEIGTELLVNGKIELEAHPHHDYINSLILYNPKNPSLPHVIDEFTNVLPNGVIIKDAVELDNGNWRIKIDAYSSLPIPLGVRVGKLKDGTTSVVEPADGETNYFIKSNGSSTIQMIKNGVTCEGFVNNAFDSYYTTVSEGLAVRTSDFDKREVELEFNPENQYVLFQGPNENISVRVYHILESLSHLFDIIQIGDKIEGLEEENIKIEIINKIISDSDVLNLINSNASDLKKLQGIIGFQMKEYIEESIENASKTALSSILKKYKIKKTAVSKNLSILETTLDVLDHINYLDAWSKIDNYTVVVKDYKLHIPSNNPVNTKPVTSPTPANGATDVSLNGNLSFTAGENTPTGATFKVYFDTNTEPTTTHNLDANTASLSYLGLEENTLYYWKVATISTNNEVLATSPIWSFTTLVNQSNVSPATPNNPKNGDVNVPLNGSITWLGGDGTPPGSTYRLYFDSNSNPQTEVSVSGQSHTYSNLSENTIFYWKVETISSSGDILATSPVWSFTTESNTAGGIYEGNLKLTTQAQIDSFNYTVVTGNLIIQESTKNDILNLNGLSNLTSVNGDLHIGYNAALTSLNGLSNLISVGEDLIISYNAVLNSLIGLSNLTSIDGDLLVFENNTLASLNALSNLTSIKGSLDIYGSRVTSLDGLHNLTTVGKDLYIRDNFDLTSLDALSKISSLKGLSISGNSSLTSLDGLHNLASIHGDVIKFDGTGSLFIRDNAALTSLNGLHNLTSVGEDLDISNNNVLTSFCGIAQLINNGQIEQNEYLVESNAFNPTYQDIIDGNCSQ